jgi:hypothetical protein
MIFLENGRSYERCHKMVNPQEWRSVASIGYEAAMNNTHISLDYLLDKIDPVLQHGIFLDICSGNGLVAIQTSWPRKINVFHIDKNANTQPLLRQARISYFLNIDGNDKDWKISSAYINQNFLNADVIDLVDDPEPVLSRVPANEISGAFLLHPPGLPEVWRASIKLAGILLPSKAPLIIIADELAAAEIKDMQETCGKFFSSQFEYPKAGIGNFGIIAFK